MLKQRFSNILGTAKKDGVVVFTVLGVTVLAVGLLVGFRFAPKPQEIPNNTDDDTTISESITLSAPKVTSDNVSNPEPKNNNGITIDENGIKINGMPIEEYYNLNNPDVYTNLDDLKKLLHDEVKVTERELENTSLLNISSGADHVNITRGGEKLYIRYYEWLENQYSLDINNGELTLKETSHPYLKTGNNYTDGWLGDCLRLMGKQPYNTIEIVIPESMKLDDIIINVGSGTVNATNCMFDRNVSINAGSGQVNLENTNFGGNASISAGSGTVTVTNCEFNGRASLNVGSGTADAVNCTFSGTVSINAGSGQLNIEDCNFGGNTSMSVGSGIGYLKLTDSAMNYDVSFNATSGKLKYNGSVVSEDALRNKSIENRIKLSAGSGSFSITDAD